MKISNISFPHPVLGVADDVRGYYSPKLGVVMARDKITLSVEHCLSNKTLQKFISEKKAFFAVELNCPQTIYRTIEISHEANHMFEINASELRNIVKISMFIVANEDMPNYVAEEANKDYAGYEFEIGKGDVLAYGGDFGFIAGKTWASSIASISSIFDIQKSNKEDGPMSFCTSEEKIIIKLSKKDYENYAEISRAHQFYSVLHSSMALPALMYALTEIIEQKETLEENEDRNEGCEWKQILESRINNEENLKKIGWDKTKIPEIAQILLKNPVDRMFGSLHSTLYQ
jgi:hypothetical protein